MAPDLVLYRQRYLMDGCATALARHDDDAYNVFRVVVEATELRFTEGGGAVNVVVDGPLTAERFDAMMAGVAATLGRLLGRPWGVQWTR